MNGLISSAMPLVMGPLSCTPKKVRSRETQNAATTTTSAMTSTIHIRRTTPATENLATQSPSVSKRPGPEAIPLDALLR
ncbi:hypothetical protein [Mycobacterium szulgai]|uniref:hypothetical protein n=1 Tax=Mycobacterium szulgai TaxID=1787 RepID=UPI0021F38EEF|nr:hypothetical protein [Mycobacterium szulgai]